MDTQIDDNDGVVYKSLLPYGSERSDDKGR